MKHLKLFFACMLMLLFGFGQLWADAGDATLTYSDKGLENGTPVDGTSYAVGTYFTVTCTKNSAGTAPTYYTTGTAVRCYATKSTNNGNIITVSRTSDGASANAYITKVTYTGTHSKKGTTSFTYSGTPTESDATSATYDAADEVTDASATLCETGGSANGQFYLTSVTVEYVYTTGGTPTCATPTFSPAAGGVLSGTEVTISSTTDGATIYYTTDGTDPSTSSATTQPVVITAATTIKAIAVKDGNNNSAVATAEYTIATPLTTMDAIFAAAGAEQDVYITFNNWIVSGVKNSNAYVTDGTKGFIIYESSNGFAVGNVLSGTVACKLLSYKGAAEVKGVKASMLTIDPTPGTAPVNVLNDAGIDALTGVNTGSVIKISGECTKPDTKYFVAGVQLYNQLFSFGDLSVGENYNCTGVYVLNTDFGNEILPRSAEEVELITSVATPTFSPAAGEYTEAQSVTITCATDGASIYYTTDGSAPSNTSTAYAGAIAVNATQTIKAIAYKGEDHSEVATAAYTINIPIPSHDFQITHTFTEAAGEVDFTGWSGSYAEHTFNFTNDNVVFAAGSKQTGTITDRPVVKNTAISLVLTNPTKMITAVRFDYVQWAAKTQTFTMTYSTDGGASYSAFDPAVTGSNFAIQALTLPEGVNAIRVIGSENNQAGLTSIAFDLADKPIVTKTVTITPPANGTLVVKNAGVAITSGDAIEVGTTLTIEATPSSGYVLGSISVVDEDTDPVTVTANAFVVPNKNVTVSATFNEDLTPDASLTLWENGNEVVFGGSHKQNDHVTLPTSVTHNCAGRVFMGWSAVEVAQTDVKPSYEEPGADFVLSAAGENTLYAVYAAVATPASYQKLESDAFETTASYVIGAEQAAGNTKMWYLSSYSNTDANINWGVMTDDPATTAPVVFTLSGTADALVAQDAAGNYLAGLNTGKFKMSSTSTTVSLSDAGIIGTTNSYVLRHNYNGGNGGLRWYNGTTGTSAYFYKVIAATYNKYSTTCDAPIDAPEFTPAEGTYTEAKSVTITAAAGATIYYTMTNDGSTPADPTTSSDVYSDAISLSAAGTYKFKAFAVKGSAESDITEATYTINLPLTTIPAVFAKATAVGSTETEVTVVFNNWVVSGIGGTDNKNVFVTDGTNGFIIFGASHGFAVNDKLSGSVTANLKLYNGAAELLNVKASDLATVTNDGVITPVVKTIDQLSGVNTGAPIIVNNVKFDGTNLTDGTNNIKPYTSLYDYTDPSSPFVTDHYYNVTGIYTQYNSTKEILPRSAGDIEELSQTAPTMTWYTSSAKTATIAANATYSISAGDEFAPVFETNSSGDLTYSSNNDAVATINASTGVLTLEGGIGDVLITCAVAEDAVNNYAAGSQSFTLRVLQGATVDNVVILAQYNGTWYAMKNTGVTSSKAAAIEVAYSGGKVWNLSISDQEAITWKRTVDGEGNVTFQAPNNNYLQMSGTNLAMGAAVCQWTWNETYYRVGSQTRTFLYRPSASGFKSNAVSNAGANDYSALPVITTAVFADGEGYTEVRAGLEINRYYTVCLPKQVTAVTGGTFWSLRYKDAEPGTMVYLEEETAPFDAGKPYIFQATATTLNVVYSGDAVSDPVENGALRGTFTTIAASAFAALPGNVYLLINNKICPRGTGNYLTANRAYIDYDALTVATPTPAPGKRVLTMPLQGQTPTGVDNLNASETPVKMIIDGKMYILRGEKMFDATGRLVK